MHWRGFATALLTAASILQPADAILITITEIASVCSAVYTTGSQSITVVKSTVTVSPVPWTDHDANHGTPFVLQVQPATGAVIARAALQPMWVTESGGTTTDGSKAAQYIIKHGELTTVRHDGFITTNVGINHQLFKVSTELGGIKKKFMVHNGMLTWTDTEFKNDAARLCALPHGHGYQVWAYFLGKEDPECHPINVMARPVREATGSTVSVSTTMHSHSGSSGKTKTRKHTLDTGTASETRTHESHHRPSATPGSNVSPNGLCSGSTNYTCTGSTFGRCCSRFGFCGHGPAYCGTGCQALFGHCSKVAVNSSMISSTSSSATAAPTPVSTFTCPADNDTRVRDDNSIKYRLGCQRRTSGGAYREIPVVGSFNDCFDLCDNDDHCTAFTYIGGANGVGSGICNLKDTEATFVKGSTDPNMVGAIRVTPFVGANSTMSYTAATLSTSTAGPKLSHHTLGSSTRSHTKTRTKSSHSHHHSLVNSSAPTSTLMSASPTSSAPISPSGHCGVQGNGGTPDGYTCAGSVFGSCCSVDGFCGSTSAYCVAGCQGEYGSCTSNKGNPITASGECGASNGNQTCTGGDFGSCCSTSGYCGSTAEYCAPSSCDPLYGTCNSSSSTTSMISTSTAPTSPTSSMPPCPTQSCGIQSSTVNACVDAYGNQLSVTCGTIYSGLITVRAAEANIGACYTLCDSTSGCLAVNYVSGQCQLLSRVDGTTQMAGGGAASRPADVSTVYTAPPSTSSSMIATTSASISPSASTSTMLMGLSTSSTLSSTIVSATTSQPGAFLTSSSRSTTMSTAMSDSPTTSNTLSIPTTLDSTSTLTTISSLPTISSTAVSSIAVSSTALPSSSSTSISTGSFSNSQTSSSVATSIASTTSTSPGTSSVASSSSSSQTTSSAPSPTSATRTRMPGGATTSSSSTSSLGSSISSTTAVTSTSLSSTTFSSTSSTISTSPTISLSSSATRTRNQSTTTTSSTTSSSTSSSSSMITSSSASSLSLASATSSHSSSSISNYLVLASPTACSYGDPPNTPEDDSYCEIDLPFAMQMYQQSNASTFASTNGYLSITEGSAQYAANTFPVSYLPNNTVAPFFDDLYLYASASPPNGIFYQINSAQNAVTYEYYLGSAAAGSFNSTDAYHFTIAYNILQPGIFVFTYYGTGGSGDDGKNCAVGTQGISGGTEEGFTYAYQSGQITPGLVVTCNTAQNTCVTTTHGGGISVSIGRGLVGDV